MQAGGAVLTGRSVSTPAELLRRYGPAAAGYALPFLLVFYLALRGGGYDSIVRGEVGIAVWWVVLLGAAVGALPATRMSRSGWIMLGLLAASGRGPRSRSAGLNRVSEARRVGARGCVPRRLHPGRCRPGPRRSTPRRLLDRRGDRRGRDPRLALAASSGLVSDERGIVGPRRHGADSPQLSAQLLERARRPRRDRNPAAAGNRHRALAIRSLAPSPPPRCRRSASPPSTRCREAARSSSQLPSRCWSHFTRAASPCSDAGARGRWWGARGRGGDQRDALRDGLDKSARRTRKATRCSQWCSSSAPESASCRPRSPSRRATSSDHGSESRAETPASLPPCVAIAAVVDRRWRLGLPGRALGPLGGVQGSDGRRPATASTQRFESASGNGRYQYWQSALDANATDPLKGIGPGTFEFWWAREGNDPRLRSRRPLALFRNSRPSSASSDFVLVGGLIALRTRERP